MSSAEHWDATFPLVRLNGAGARDFLQGQTTADLRDAADGELRQSCWLTATGRLRALLELRLDSEGADVLVLAGNPETLSVGFDQVIFPADRVRLGEGRQQRRVQPLTPDAAPTWLLSGETLPTAMEGSNALDPLETERWRLQQGFPPGDGELSGDTNPLELGLTDRISLDKGCYLGQETMAKLAGKGGVKQQLRCWRCEAPLQNGERLFADDVRAGVVTSVQALPDDTWIGLALVRRQSLPLDALSGPAGQRVVISRPTLFQDPPGSD